MQGVYRQPVQYRAPQLFRRPNYEAPQLRWLLNRGTEQYVIAQAGPYNAYSIFDSNSAAGNALVVSKYWTPSGNAVGIAADGIPFESAPSTGRQSLNYREWTATGWVVVLGNDGINATLYMANGVPVPVGTIPDQSAYTNVYYEGPIFRDYVTDAELDELVFTTNDPIPNGLIMGVVTVDQGLPSERSVARFIGTPLQSGTFPITIRVTDIVGDYVDLMSFVLTVGIGQLMPNTYDTDLSAGLAAIGAVLTSSTIITREQEGPIPGYIISTSPLPGEYVPPGTAVTVFYAPGIVADLEIVPNLIGLSEAPARAAIEAIECLPEVIGTSGVVVQQSPAAESLVPQGTTITITLSDVQQVGAARFQFINYRARFSADN